MAVFRRTFALALALAGRAQGLRLVDEEGANAAGNVTVVRGGHVKWTYFPPEPRVGIVTGGSPEEFKEGSYGQRNAMILLQYAKRKGYALYVDKDIGRHTRRHISWSKLHVMHELVDDVPMLVWMDPDIVMTRPDFSLETLVKQSPCNGVHQTRWEEYLPDEVQDDTALWFSASNRYGGKDQYEVNTAPGMMVLRRGPLAKEFLEQVWHVGDAPDYFAHHSASATGAGESGEWPREQGAIWDVLASKPEKYMRKSCIPAPGHLVSLDNHHWTEKTMLRRLSDKSLEVKNEVVGRYFSKFGLTL